MYFVILISLLLLHPMLSTSTYEISIEPSKTYFQEGEEITAYFYNYSAYPVFIRKPHGGPLSMLQKKIDDYWEIINLDTGGFLYSQTVRNIQVSSEKPFKMTFPTKTIRKKGIGVKGEYRFFLNITRGKGKDAVTIYSPTFYIE